MKTKRETFILGLWPMKNWLPIVNRSPKSIWDNFRIYRSKDWITRLEFLDGYFWNCHSELQSPVNKLGQRAGGLQGGREKETSLGCFPKCMDRDRNHNLLVHGTMLQLTESPSQGNIVFSARLWAPPGKGPWFNSLWFNSLGIQWTVPEQNLKRYLCFLNK